MLFKWKICMAINLIELQNDLRRCSKKDRITQSNVNNLLRGKNKHLRDLFRI